MIWLPTPLSAFTDALPEIKAMLRTCAFYLYGWVCDEPNVRRQAEAIRAGLVPAGYRAELRKRYGPKVETLWKSLREIEPKVMEELIQRFRQEFDTRADRRQWGLCVRAEEPRIQAQHRLYLWTLLRRLSEVSKPIVGSGPAAGEILLTVDH